MNCLRENVKENMIMQVSMYTGGGVENKNLKNNINGTSPTKFSKISQSWCLSAYLLVSIWFFFHKHSRFPGQQEKEEHISLSPLYHSHPLHSHLDISQTITAESSFLHIASSRTRTENLYFPSASC